MVSRLVEESLETALTNFQSLSFGDKKSILYRGRNVERAAHVRKEESERERERRESRRDRPNSTARGTGLNYFGEEARGDFMGLIKMIPLGPAAQDSLRLSISLYTCPCACLFGWLLRWVAQDKSQPYPETFVSFRFFSFVISFFFNFFTFSSCAFLVVVICFVFLLPRRLLFLALLEVWFRGTARTR